MLGWLEGAASKGNSAAKIGEDNDVAWNDRHIQYVWLWLTMNEKSPFCSAPNMLLEALKIHPTLKSKFKKQFNTGDMWLRFSTRRMITYRLKEICGGKYLPRVDKRDSKGRIFRFTILENPNPAPYPIPAFYRGTLHVTTKGIKLFVRGAVQVNAPRVSKNEEKEKLLNPFGRQ